MKASITFNRAMLIACLAAPALPATAVAQNRCDNPQQLGERRACAELQRGGIEAMQRYIQRSRAVHGLYIMDFVTPDTAAADKAAGNRDSAKDREQERLTAMKK